MGTEVRRVTIKSKNVLTYTEIYRVSKEFFPIKVYIVEIVASIERAAIHHRITPRDPSRDSRETAYFDYRIPSCRSLSRCFLITVVPRPRNSIAIKDDNGLETESLIVPRTTLFLYPVKRCIRVCVCSWNLGSSDRAIERSSDGSPLKYFLDVSIASEAIERNEPRDLFSRSSAVPPKKYIYRHQIGTKNATTTIVKDDESIKWGIVVYKKCKKLDVQ